MKIGKIEIYLNEITFEIWNIKNPEISEIRTEIVKLLFDKYPDRKIDYSDYNKEWEGIATMNFKNFVSHDGFDYYDNEELQYQVLIGCKIINKFKPSKCLKLRVFVPIVFEVEKETFQNNKEKTIKKHILDKYPKLYNELIENKDFWNYLLDNFEIV